MDCSGISITDEGKKEINKITIYRKPGINLRKNEWNKFLEQFNNTETIITGVFNAHNREWNCRRTDSNGAVLSDILWENDMYVINEDTLSHMGIRSLSNKGSTKQKYGYIPEEDKQNIG